MIAVLHMVIDIAFFTAMTWLFSKRLDNLEDWQKDVEQRLSSVEVKTKTEVKYWMEQAEKR